MSTGDEKSIYEAFKRSLKDNSGGTNVSPVASLSPNYVAVWANILGSWAIIVVAIVSLTMISEQLRISTILNSSTLVALTVLATLVVGLAVHSLANWFHEAAHYNIHRNKDRNDLFANLFMGILVLQDIRDYRPLHFDHHRHHGETNDPEHSYFEKIDLKFIIKGLFGISAVRTLLDRRTYSSADTSVRRRLLVPIAGVIFHCTILGGLFSFSAYSAAAAWLIGVFSLFPLISGLRQALEHRNPVLNPGQDFKKVPHGRFTRSFKSGPLSWLLGPAGFDRHLLHHWEPQLSCTRFNEFENRILQSPLRDFYVSRQSTYPAALLSHLHIKPNSQ